MNVTTHLALLATLAGVGLGFAGIRQNFYFEVVFVTLGLVAIKLLIYEKLR